MTTNEKLGEAARFAYEIDTAIARLRERLQVLIGDLQGEKRPHEAGILIGVSANLRDSWYRKLGGQLEDMQE